MLPIVLSMITAKTNFNLEQSTGKLDAENNKTVSLMFTYSTDYTIATDSDCMQFDQPAGQI